MGMMTLDKNFLTLFNQGFRFFKTPGFRRMNRFYIGRPGGTNRADNLETNQF